MLPTALAAPVDGFVHAMEKALPGRIEAVYIVGSPALGDFSARQSNLDLVVVSDAALADEEEHRLRRLERHLERAHRRPVVWYTTWELVAAGPVDPGEGARSPLDTPMTRGLLRAEAVPVTGPDWPVVAYDEDVFRSWCRRRLVAVAGLASGPMVMRRGVSPLVLEVARLAEVAITGRVLSKSEAGEASTRLVPAHFRRILTDAVGYRRGAHTSMYWGPFERKYDARELIRHLLEAAR